MKLRIFVEGAGRGKDAKSACRRAFASLFAKSGMDGMMPAVIPCGGRAEAYRDFNLANRTRRDNELPLLLVDSEKPVSTSNDAWTHMHDNPGDKWERPSDAAHDQAHLMVQCMETWLLADRAALESFFGPAFHSARLPKAMNLEEVTVDDCLRGLEAATRDCKRPYSKGSLAFDLLAEADPSVIRKRLPWAERFFSTVVSRNTDG